MDKLCSDGLSQERVETCVPTAVVSCGFSGKLVMPGPACVCPRRLPWASCHCWGQWASLLNPTAWTPCLFPPCSLWQQWKSLLWHTGDHFCVAYLCSQELCRLGSCRSKIVLPGKTHLTWLLPWDRLSAAARAMPATVAWQYGSWSRWCCCHHFDFYPCVETAQNNLRNEGPIREDTLNAFLALRKSPAVLMSTALSWFCHIHSH